MKPCSASISEASPKAVLQRFTQARRGSSGKLLTGGLSGAVLWRVVGEEGEFVLRRWPIQGLDRRRLEFIHSALCHAVSSGIEFIPCPVRSFSGESLVHWENAWWELAPFMPGKAEIASPMPNERLRNGATALAKFHRAMEGYVPSSEVEVAALPCIAKRRKRVSEARQINCFDRRRPVNSMTNVLTIAECAKLTSAITETLPGVEAWLQSPPLVRIPIQTVMGDPRQEHFLFTDDAVTGLIDFGAMTNDTVAVDVARFLGDTCGDNVEDWHTAALTYEAIRPLSRDEWNLVAALDASGLVLACANWLRWLLIEGRRFDDFRPVRERISHLSSRLNTLASGREVAYQAIRRLHAR